MSDRARELRDAFRQCLLAQQVLDDARRPCGTPLPLPHAYALLELLRHDAPMSVGQLAKKLSIDRTNVSRLCAQMERDGELKRDHDPEDGRARLVRLTARGTKLAKHVDESSAAYFSRIAQRLGRDSPRIVKAFLAFEAAVLEQQSEAKQDKHRGDSDPR